MDDETKKIIDTQFNALPKTIQDTIMNSGWNKKAHSIAKKYQLHIDQEGMLVNEVFLIMLGLELISDFHQNLINNLGISTIIASQLEGDMNEEILKPIRAELQQVNRQIEEAEIAASKKNSDTETALTRENILKEIEDPKPAPSMAEAIAGDVPASVPNSVLKEESLSAITNEISTQATPAPAISTMPTSDMVADKLKKTVKSSKEEVAGAYSQTPTPPQVPKKIDPYRETV